MGGSYCVNDDSTGDSSGDTCSAWYDANPAGCGMYDTDEFVASEQCCVCEGVIRIDPNCVNDDSVSDSTDDTCTGWYDDNAGGCGGWDTSTFTAADACCVCGGGFVCTNDNSVSD